MTKEEAKKMGATHYTPDATFGENYYFKVTGDDVCIWQLGKRWARTIRKFDEYENLKPL